MTNVSLSSKRNAPDLLVDEPDASRVRAMVDLELLDLCNVDESLETEAVEHTQWKVGT